MNNMNYLLKSMGRAALFGLVAAALFWQQGFAYQMSEDNVKKAVETWVNITKEKGDSAIKIESMEAYSEKGLVVGYIAHFKTNGFCLASNDNHALPVYLYNPKGIYNAADEDYQAVLSAIGRAVRGETGGTLIDESELRWRETCWGDLIAGNKPQPWVPVETVAAPKVQPLAAAQGPAQASAISEIAVDHIVLNLTSKWHQGTPFNDQCPAHAHSGQHAVVGCNGTAAAQVAYYWKWPVTGVGTGALSIPYDSRWATSWIQEPFSVNPNIPSDPFWDGRLQYDGNPGGTHYLLMNGDWDNSVVGVAKSFRPDDDYYKATIDLLYNNLPNQPAPFTDNINFGAATYNWALMQDVHDGSTTGNAEVAKLSYQIAAHANTGYGICGTGSNLNDIRSTLVDHLRYNGDATFHLPVGTQYERNQMVAEMQEELRYLRPVLLGGTNANGGGHAYAVWGFDVRQGYPMFLFNYGWGKGADRKDSIWYTLEGSEFPNNQDRLVQVAPLDEVRFTGPTTTPGAGNPNNPFDNVVTAVATITAGQRLILKAGTTNTVSTNYTITKEMTVLGHESVITAQ